MVYGIAERLYELALPHLSPIQRQRARVFLWGVWRYLSLLRLSSLTIRERVKLIGVCLRADWSVELCHWPGEVVATMLAIGERRARTGEVMVEAGCWQGGSTVKWSVFCSMLGYELLVYDSFEGCEAVPAGDPDSWFAGRYAAREDVVRASVSRYGDISACRLIPGWYSDTLAKNPIRRPVRGVYIDCDLRKGTLETLQGVLPAMVDDGVVCSQDYHLASVAELLDDPATWYALGRNPPVLEARYRKVVVLRVGGYAPQSSSR